MLKNQEIFCWTAHHFCGNGHMFAVFMKLQLLVLILSFSQELLDALEILIGLFIQ